MDGPPPPPPQPERDDVVRALEGLARDALVRIGTDHGLGVADVALLVRARGAVDQCTGGLAAEGTTTTMGAARNIHMRRQLAQLWALLETLHASLVSGSKATQRELWYRLKPSGLFASPAQVNARILDLAAAVSLRLGAPCSRELLGVTAAPRGSITGCLTIVPPCDTPTSPGDAPTTTLPDSPPPSSRYPRDATAHPNSTASHRAGLAVGQPLDASVFQVPGDTEAIRRLGISAADRRARCVLVVEKDSVFRRLVDDRFAGALPCVLVTACGFPDLATRALVRKVTAALGLRAFALTDYNPHGLALMLAYKHGTDALGLERDASCPSLEWLGLRADHVAAEGHTLPTVPVGEAPARGDPLVGGGDANDRDDHDDDDDHDGRVAASPPRGGETVYVLPDDARQPLSSRDKALLGSLSKRPEVRADGALLDEIDRMGSAGYKVEIEALHGHGFAFLARFLRRHIHAALARPPPLPPTEGGPVAASTAATADQEDVQEEGVGGPPTGEEREATEDEGDGSSDGDDDWTTQHEPRAPNVTSADPADDSDEDFWQMNDDESFMDFAPRSES